MPPDLPNQQEITLKKRARRRLVGAIALVLLMVIVLPSILQDRASLTSPQSIKVTMVDHHNAPLAASDLTLPNEKVVEIKDALADSPAPVATQPPDLQQPTTALPALADANANNSSIAHTSSEHAVVVTSPEKPALSQKALQPATDNTNKTNAGQSAKKAALKKPALDTDAEILALPNSAIQLKENSSKSIETNPTKAEVSPSKNVTVKSVQDTPTSFTVQVGVFSDVGNVKHLQEKLKEIGYGTHTEKIATPKGEKIRLRAGSFSSRQDASVAQAKMKKIGLVGMVVGND